MKAIFGKLSIACFVLSFIALILGMTTDLYDALSGVPLFPPIGVVFGYLSALKQETPKCYRYAGFILNFVWFFVGGTMLFLYIFSDLGGVH